MNISSQTLVLDQKMITTAEQYLTSLMKNPQFETLLRTLLAFSPQKKVITLERSLSRQVPPGLHVKITAHQQIKLVTSENGHVEEIINPRYYKAEICEPIFIFLRGEEETQKWFFQNITSLENETKTFG